jgi:hypothetical protein
MLYPTHSVAMVLSVTGARATSVSCLGVVDAPDDGVFRPDVSRWRNRFSNESALVRTSDGGVMRINEFRRVGVRAEHRSVRASLFGTLGSFEEQPAAATWASLHDPATDVADQIECGGVHTHEQWEAIQVDVALKGDFASGFAPVHQPYRARLPLAYRTQPNGHEGSHQFLTDDFVTAVVRGRTPTVSVWDAARFNAPGIVAHESAQRDGERLRVPDFGS